MHHSVPFGENALAPTPRRVIWTAPDKPSISWKRLPRNPVFDEAEVRRNPRARSALLRVAEKVA